MNLNSIIGSKNRRWFLIASGYVFSLGLAFVLIIVFMGAYFNGFRVVVTVNDYGEAHIEFVMLLVFTPFMILGCILHFLELRHTKKQGGDEC